MTNPLEWGGEPELNADFKNKIIKKWDDLRPKERDFAISEGNSNGGIYQSKEIIEDLKRVKEIKESPDYVKSRTVASIVAEYALPQLIEDE